MITCFLRRFIHSSKSRVVPQIKNPSSKVITKKNPSGILGGRGRPPCQPPKVKEVKEEEHNSQIFAVHPPPLHHIKRAALTFVPKLG